MKAFPAIVFFYLLSAQAAQPVHAVSAYTMAHHPVTTKSAAAQSAFDEGLTLLYSYNRQASYQAFERAAKADPRCAMCWWGMAIAQGSNVNTVANQESQKAAYDDVKDAQSLEAVATDEEKAYIEALAYRYSADPNRDLHQLAINYNAAMNNLSAKYPDDDDAAALYAESGLELHPWHWFTSDGQASEGMDQVITALEKVLKRNPTHIGANHFYIHAVEESRHPERALPSAARLDAMTFEPAGAHLVHMPAHIYMRTGNFDKATRSNEHATADDREYMHMNPDDNEAAGYHNHNLMMLVSGYEMEGDSTDATRVAKMLHLENDELPVVYEALRFRLWNVIRAIPEPARSGQPLYPVMWHFAQGMALVSQGRLTEAKAQRDVVAAAATQVHEIAHLGSNNSSVSLIHIARDVLDASIARAQGDAAKEVASLQDGVTTQDSMIYTEPPDWYFPVREGLGGALLRQSQFARAEQVFRADLDRDPKNPRSLFGLAATLKSEGKNAEAEAVSRQFDDAWKHADVKLSVADL